MPNPGSAAAAPSLAETVDLLGIVVAKMSEKLDQNGETLAAIQKTALESRDAAQTAKTYTCLLYTSPSPRDRTRSRMPSSA